MAITDLTSMSKPQSDQRERIKRLMESLSEINPEVCQQCGKCTSGCEAYKLLELEPHKIMAIIKSGFVDELVNSDVIWTCMTCMKCKERCPQELSPVDVIFALKNIAIAAGKDVKGEFPNWLQSILGTGFIQGVKDVVNRKSDAANRDSLQLPKAPAPADLGKLGQVLMKAAMEQF